MSVIVNNVANEECSKEDSMDNFKPEWKAISHKAGTPAKTTYRCISCVENCPITLPVNEEPPKVCQK